MISVLSGVPGIPGRFRPRKCCRGPSSVRSSIGFSDSTDCSGKANSPTGNAGEWTADVVGIADVQQVDEKALFNTPVLRSTWLRSNRYSFFCRGGFALVSGLWKSSRSIMM
jgi:hypothetical protein